MAYIPPAGSALDPREAADAAPPTARIILVAATAALGGFLFGFDTAVINGAVGAIRDWAHVGDALLGFSVASALLGSAVGAWFAVPLEVHQQAWPTEDFELAQSLVGANIPEDDLFAGVREFASTYDGRRETIEA